MKVENWKWHARPELAAAVCERQPPQGVAASSSVSTCYGGVTTQRAHTNLHRGHFKSRVALTVNWRSFAKFEFISTWSAATCSVAVKCGPVLRLASTAAEWGTVAEVLVISYRTNFTFHKTVWQLLLVRTNTRAVILGQPINNSALGQFRVFVEFNPFRVRHSPAGQQQHTQLHEKDWEKHSFYQQLFLAVIFPVCQTINSTIVVLWSNMCWWGAVTSNARRSGEHSRKRPLERSVISFAGAAHLVIFRVLVVEQGHSKYGVARQRRSVAVTYRPWLPSSFSP